MQNSVVPRFFVVFGSFSEVLKIVEIGRFKVEISHDFTRNSHENDQ